MPTGYPGAGPTAGRKRGRSDPARRRGAFSGVERSLISALARDQPGSVSQDALERQVDRLARVLRRSPAAVRKAVTQSRYQHALDAAYADAVPGIRAARLEVAELRRVLESLMLSPAMLHMARGSRVSGAQETGESTEPQLAE
jgi:hypothetical protein